MALCGRTVSFKGGEGCAWKDLTYACTSCSFLVYEAGVTGEAMEGTPGLLVNLRNSGSELAVTCQASECLLTSILSSGKAKSQKLYDWGNRSRCNFGARFNHGYEVKAS